MRSIIQFLVAVACTVVGFAAVAANTAPRAAAVQPLTKTDADAWLDGLMPYALDRGDIAGAVVVIVKDGEVLTQRGFGHADLASGKAVDPSNTLFRVGSISKLFTWTAVMQQVEAGKIDLDADVNRYLDFRIPPFEGKALTMRDIMTHTTGFDDVIKGGFTFGGKPDPLGVVVKRLLPPRVTSTRSTPAYSNYATALAGYIVERVSGLSFDSYTEQHIFAPLGMTHATFRQPLPPALAPLMSSGYSKASEGARPFEIISVPPAGSLTMSGSDGAKFMLSILANAKGLMGAGAAARMLTPAGGAIPGLNRMALGFYEQRINDTYAIGHGGDLIYFHGYMWMFPAEQTGLLVFFNSAGEGNVTSVLRQRLFEEFGDRYLPTAGRTTPAAPLTELPTAKAHAQMLAGTYLPSRTNSTNFLDIGSLLGQLKIGIDDDGRPRVPELFDHAPRRWIEISPFVWQDAVGHARLGAVVEDGKVTRWSVDEVSPFMVFDRAPWYRDATWLLPATLGSLAVLLLTALSWPIGFMLRRHFQAPLQLPAAQLRARRLVSLFSGLLLITVAGWAVVLSQLSNLATGIDWQIWMVEILGVVAILGLIATTLWRLWLNRRASSSERLRGVLFVLSAGLLAYVGWSFQLFSFGTKF